MFDWQTIKHCYIMSTTLIVILAIAAALVLWGIGVQNKLVQAD